MKDIGATNSLHYYTLRHSGHTSCQNSHYFPRHTQPTHTGISPRSGGSVCCESVSVWVTSCECGFRKWSGVAVYSLVAASLANPQAFNQPHLGYKLEQLPPLFLPTPLSGCYTKYIITSVISIHNVQSLLKYTESRYVSYVHMNLYCGITMLFIMYK